MILNVIIKEVNKYLSNNPDFDNIFIDFEKSVLCIDIVAYEQYFIRFDKKTMELTQDQSNIRATISLEISDLVRFTMKTPRKVSNLGGIISGDVEFIQMLYMQLNKSNFDIEEYISMYIGDIPANKLFRLINSIIPLKKFDKVSNNFAELLVEEYKLLLGKDLFNDFSDKVYNISCDVDRLNQRISKIKGYLK